jgi:uncharacterized protein YggT (Ycf19 family)
MADDIDDERPELIGDRTIELMILAARALVIVIYVVVLVTFAILALGFFLHLVGASSEASFVDWAYRNTERAMQPFRGMFPIEKIDSRSTYDPSLLFAAAVYGFFAIGLHALVNYLTGVARARHRRTVEHEAAQAAAARAHEARPVTAAAEPTGRFVAGTAADDTKEVALVDETPRPREPEASVEP